MLINTMRFGEIEIDDRQVISFPWGLPGFASDNSFVPIEYQDKGQLCFLQSTTTPELTFIIADPFYFLEKQYVVDIPAADLEALEIDSPEEAAVYVILSIRDGGKIITANLAAPLVINTSKRTGRQVILVNSPYNTQFILKNQAKPQPAASAHGGK